eukprot:c4517_g1_i3.p1 GENE.c4517_g1_i3~~c4517_g1_i3.p1  ORF type:complete len:122 (-),score=18.45 c4517_g1_i3:146-511(-)
MYCSYALNRNPAVWPDPFTFKPERWLDNDGAKPYTPNKEPSAFKFLSFNAGPRLCLGKGFSYMETKLCLAHLLTTFDLDWAGKPHSGEYKMAVVLTLKGGLPVVAKRRAEPPRLPKFVTLD